MDELLADFLEETAENLDALDQGLAALVKKSSDRNAVDASLRAVHTIKSSCAFLKLHAIEALAGRAEDILSALRDGEEDINDHMFGLLHDSAASMRIMVKSLEPEKSETPEHAANAVWNRLPLIVHDLAASLGKKAVLKIDGGDVLIEGAALKPVRESLTHMARNAVSHGIESPGERIKAGKPETGEIRLTLSRDGKNIVIELSDDGAGLSALKIRRKIIEKNLMPKVEAASLPDAQIYGYIFQPGFSTAENVTDASGRGVGLDAAHAGITGLGGSISVESTEGAGSRFIITIPA